MLKLFHSKKTKFIFILVSIEYLLLVKDNFSEKSLVFFLIATKILVDRKFPKTAKNNYSFGIRILFPRNYMLDFFFKISVESGTFLEALRIEKLSILILASKYWLSWLSKCSWFLFISLIKFVFLLNYRFDSFHQVSVESITLVEENSIWTSFNFDPCIKVVIIRKRKVLLFLTHLDFHTHNHP